MSIKKSVLIIVGLIIIICTSFAQKFGYVDTDFILNQIPNNPDAITYLNEVE